MKRHLVILCHDVIDDHFDRRISQQANLWIQGGWDVTIVGMTTSEYGSVERWENGVFCIKIDQQNLLPVHDELWKKADRSSLAEIIAPEVKDPAEDAHSRPGPGDIRRDLFVFARSLWKRLPLPLRQFGWWCRARIAKIASRWQKPSPIVEAIVRSLPTDWYPLPFSESLYARTCHLNPHAILACDLTTIPAALRLCAQTGAVLLYDSHEFYPEQDAFTERQKELLRAWDERGFREAFVAYSVSAAMASVIQQHYGLDKKPDYLTNAPDFNGIVSDKKYGGPLRRKIGATSTDRVLLYHGGFVRSRNLDVLIAGFARAHLEETHLVLLGYGDRDWVEGLKSEAGGSIHVLDAVPAVELDRWISDADFVVIPYPAIDRNTQFCSPNKLHDCIALGIPVLVNRELRDVVNILANYKIGLALDLSTCESTANSLSAILRLQTNDADFEGARRDLGWASQAKKVRSWILAVEQECVRRAGQSALRHLPAGRGALQRKQQTANRARPDDALYNDDKIWDRPLELSQERMIDALALAWPEDITSALDVGCGDAKLSTELQRRTGTPIVGLDFSASALRHARVPVASADAGRLPIANEAFDLTMSTDVLEHLDDDKEQAVLFELFRVTRKIVAIGVPYRENLSDAFTQCQQCRTIYHLNWHKRSYAADSLAKRTPNGWKLAGLLLTGASWIQVPSLVFDWMASAHKQWAYWDLALCPECGHRNEPVSPSRVPAADEAVWLAECVYQDASINGLRSANHTEIVGLFVRDDDEAQKLAARLGSRMAQRGLIASFATMPANVAVIPDSLQKTNGDLVQFPLVTHVLQDENRGLVIQSPAFGAVDQIGLDFKNRSDGTCQVTVEDGLGVVISTEICISERQSIVLLLPRVAKPGLYGIIVRMRGNLPDFRIQIGASAAVEVLRSRTTPHLSYLFGEPFAGATVVNQVVGGMWMGRDQTDLSSPHSCLSGDQIISISEAVSNLLLPEKWEKFRQLRAAFLSLD